ncbi:MAG: dephospho-CoA kinase [Betaproteobacteria bacterium]|nr:dephospho-CoA kinase [Betaproteobacteria bacterium]
MTLMIGLTGGIGSGKTATAAFFAALGADVVDTDVIAHELARPHGPAVPAIRQTFGEKYITDDGALNRKEMRELVFSDDNSRRKLEAILHPLIRTEVVRRTARFCGPYGIIVVPLLLETGDYREMIHRVLVVDCNEQTQLVRTITRAGLDERTVRTIMATQLSRMERLKQADDVIVNDSDMPHLKHQVDVLHNKYLALGACRT